MLKIPTAWPVVGNQTLLRWFLTLCEARTVKSEASYLFKSYGVGRTVLYSFSDLLSDIREGLADKNCAFIVHTNDDFRVIVSLTEGVDLQTPRSTVETSGHLGFTFPGATTPTSQPAPVSTNSGNPLFSLYSFASPTVPRPTSSNASAPLLVNMDFSSMRSLLAQPQTTTSCILVLRRSIEGPARDRSDKKKKPLAKSSEDAPFTSFDPDDDFPDKRGTLRRRTGLKAKDMPLGSSQPGSSARSQAMQKLTELDDDDDEEHAAAMNLDELTRDE